MLMTASSLGYIPSTLSLMRMLTGVPKQAFSKVKLAFRDAEAQFRRLVQAENNPDAFTIQGLLLQQEGRADSSALNYFDKAIETAARNTPPSAEDQPKPAKQAVRSPRWAYEGTCHQQRGLILLRKGRTEEAVASFRIVALELDLADGHAELAKLLPRDAPERETCLLKAAQAGNFEACRLLALDLADKAADPALPKADRIGAGNMAHEWAQIDPDPTRREELGAQVAERTREVMGGKTFVRA
jgi:tetratricopeptide (TPR) repeat protein